jgi:ribonuclease/Dockerin type I domain
MMALGKRKNIRFIPVCLVLEDRDVPAFPNWSSIGPAIAGVPVSSGHITSVSVVNFGTTVYTGPLNVANTLNRIRANGTPLDGNDGSVYSNTTAPLLPTGTGTWFEFVVNPSTGTDQNFGSQFSSPGPMRVLLDSLSDVYFTGDHYSSFKLVYQHGQAIPTIGSFTLTPTSVPAGNSTTLTASNVAETGGTVASVKFYRESNGTSGLQTSTDTLVGNGSPSGTTWTLSTATTGFVAGSYTYYAVATDNNAASSATSSTSLTVTSGTPTPTIGSFTVSPVSVVVGGSTTLTAGSVIETSGTIASVKFYRESNGTSGLQTATDTLIGTGTQSGTTWSLSTTTSGLSAGNYTYYALAADSVGTTATASTTLAVTNPAATGVALAWDVNGQSNFGTQGLAADQVATGLANSTTLTRGSGVTTTGTAANNAWGGNGWATTSALGVSGVEFVTFGMTVATGHTLSLSSIDLYYRRSSSGPSDGLWQYQLGGGVWVTIADVTNEFSSTSTSGAAMAELSLAGSTGLQNVAAGTAVVIRLVPYGSTNTGGTWYVDDTTGNDLVVNGAVATIPPTITHDNAAVTVNEGSTSTNTGTFSDTQGNGSATISASVGMVTQDNTLGTWSWSFPTQDGPDNTQTVTVTATNTLGATATTTFSLVVNNVAPTGVANLPTVTTPNALVAASITGVTDPSPIDTAAGFLYSFDWTNDGTFDVNQSTSNSASYSYPTVGSYTARIRVQDKDGGFTDYLKPITVAAAPTVSVQIGDGSAQRSIVQSLTVTFTGPVVFTATVAAAITLQRTSSTGPTEFVNLVFSPASGPASSFTITFDDAVLATPVGTTKSLIDGRYTLAIDAAQVQSSVTGLAFDGNADGTPGDNFVMVGDPATNKLFRLFGDANGDGSVGANDFVLFRQFFNGADGIFDFDGDGFVSASDFVQFKNRFNTSI